LSQSASPETAGFTLIEAVVALGVVAAGVAAIGLLASSNLRATLHAERRVADIEAARMILTGLPGRKALPFGRFDGSLDGHDWRINSTAVAAASSAHGQSPWTPQGVALLVRSPYGATIEVDTIRLRRQAKP